MPIFDDIKQLYERTMAKLSEPNVWREFLACVCHNYKLRFDEQVLLFAQRPDATAVATFQQWFKLYRPVKKGQTAIRVLDSENGSRNYIRYYDISDTAELKNSLPIPIWNMKDEYQQSVVSALEQSFGSVNRSSFENTIISSAQNIADENLKNYHRNILITTENSFLDGLGDDAVLSIYSQIVTDSIAYSMLSRLGVNAEDYIEIDNFSEIINFNTAGSMFALGEAVQQLSAMGLSVAARAIKNYEMDYYKEAGKNEVIRESDSQRENTIQSRKAGKRQTTVNRTQNRGASEGVFQKDNGALVHTGSGNGNIRSESENSGGRTAPGQYVHTLQGEIPERRKNGDVHRSAVFGDFEQTPQRAIGEMSRDGKQVDERNRSEGGLDGGTESKGLVGIRSTAEQHSEQSARDSSQRDDLRLEWYDRTNEDKSLPFLWNDKTIKKLILNAELSVSKEEIINFYKTHEHKRQRANFIKSIFSPGITEIKLSDGETVGYKPFQNVLQMWSGTYTDKKSQSYYDWGIIADYFEAMRLLGELKSDYNDNLTNETDFSFTQEIIDFAVKKGSIVEGGKARIYSYFLENHSAKDNEDFLKKEYGTGGHSPILAGLGVGEDHNAKGLQLNRGYGKGAPKLTLKWSEVAERIKYLIAMERYLTPEEKEKLKKSEEKNNTSPRAEIEENSTSAFILPKEESEKSQQLQLEVQYKINTSPKPETVKKMDYVASVGERHNFHITDCKLGYGTPKEKFRANIAAIQLLKKCLEENRYATADEQEILSKYIGWGGLSDAFDNSKSSWSYEYLELKTVLTEEEYSSARQSALTAFYTPPVVIKSMYTVLGHLGFSEGNILEPSCGVGNFIGMLPDSMQDSKIYGVELDNISAAIAAQLYQTAKITNSGFEETSYPDNFFDVVIGNIPFGDLQINDKRYNKFHFLIHDYFFAKSLDKVRPGGIIAFITSKGTMDKTNPSVRKYIAQRAELLGAIRLPDDTFKANAGTKITSDILFLQKRERMIDIEPDWVHLDTDANGIAMNSYFVQHPDMILGKMKTVSGRHGLTTTCSHIEGTKLEAQLSRAITGIHGKITVPEITDEQNEEDIEIIPADPNVRNFSYTIIDDNIYLRENSVMIKQNFKGMAEKRIKALLPIRDCVRHLINLQLQDYPNEVIQKEQLHLNVLYDKFTSDYGRIRSRGNYAAFKDDCSYSLLSSLEKTDDEGNFIGKADIFTKRTIVPHKPVTYAETSAEALAVSLGEKACVDMEYMRKLTNKKEDAIYRELSGSIFLNPLYSDGNLSEHKYLPQDEYLSGNVREKLKIAKLAAEKNSAFNVNVTALENVQPKDLTAAEISVKLGTTWIDEKYIQQFMEEIFILPFWAKERIRIHYSSYSGAWQIEGKSSYSNVKTSSVYGTKRISAFGILENSLNLKEVKILDYFEDADGKKRSKLNEKETQIAQEKQKQLRQAFQDWIWKDPERRDVLTSLYNERFNCDRLREYDGSHLVFAGINPEITLRPHQLNAIARIIYGGNSLLAHVVGAGKTFEIVAAAQESKRLGLCSKSLIVVPKHLTEQWGTSYLQLYPAANILVSRQDDFSSAERRKRFCSRIATGDYDAVIIGQTQFERLKMSTEYQKNHIKSQIEEITLGIQQAKSTGASNFTVKDLERTKKNLTAKLEKLNDQDKKDVGITFEELGIDRLFVDEAHYYKNLYMYTKMQNVKGINTTAAEKSSDMYMKVRYIDELTEGRGVIFATGTPISNSMVEMYTMQRYLQYQALRSKEIHTFDAWAGTYGETVSDYELKPEGQGYQLTTRFAKFTNIPELLTQFRMVADIQTSDMLKLDVPGVERHNVVLQASDYQKAMIEGLAQRAKDFRDGKKKDSPQEMLLITNEGRKLALDQRIINPLLPDDDRSKSTACAENIIKIYRETSDFKGTQLVFCDLSTPKSDGNFNVYDDLKNKLIDRGIPKAEIKFIHEANTDKAKDELFGKVRSGAVRVLIGSTQKMGAGTNVQDKLIALHHLDCPWTPANLEQREGRIIRQGNNNDKVHIFTYVTEGTFDAYMYQLLVRKQRFISQIMTGNATARTCEDIDERSLNYSEIMAIATGNPMIKEAAELERDIAILTTLRTDFYKQKYSLEDDVNKHFPNEILRLERTITGLEHDIEVVKQHPKPPDGFVGMTLKGTYYSDKEKAGDALLETIKGIKTPNEDIEIGKYRGFIVSVCYNAFTKNYVIKLKSELSHSVEVGESTVGNIQRMDNSLLFFSSLLMKAERSLQDTKEQLETAKIECKKEFPKEQELRNKTERLNEIRAELNDNKSEKDVMTETKTI